MHECSVDLSSQDSQIHFRCGSAHETSHKECFWSQQKKSSRRCSALNCRTQSLDLTRSPRQSSTQTTSYARCPLGTSSTLSTASNCIMWRSFCFPVPLFATRTLGNVQTIPLHPSSSQCHVSRPTVPQSPHLLLRSLVQHSLCQCLVSVTRVFHIIPSTASTISFSIRFLHISS